MRPALLLLILAGCGGPRPASSPTPSASLPPVPDLLSRVDRFLQGREVDGVARASKAWSNVTEEIRLSVVPQLLGYAELFRRRGDPRFREDVAARATFLAEHLDTVLSGGPFDGMVGYALLEAWEATRDERHLAKGKEVVAKCLALPPRDMVLNGGLMAAMAFAKHHAITKDATSKARAESMIDSLPARQNADGSFPHWTAGSTDVHYTAWMGMELVLIRRSLPYAAIDPILAKISAFLHGRIGPEGRTVYESEGRKYYSLATGCPQDYDTRGWTNEQGYLLLVFDAVGDPAYAPVLKFLSGVEKEGGFPDKWAYPHAEGDPVRPYSIDDPSVVRTSLVFWALAAHAK